MEPRRGYGMASPEVKEPPRRVPLWANPAAWGLFGALLGAGIFVFSKRAGLERVARRNLPQAQAAARLVARRAEVLAAQAHDAAAKAKELTGTAEPAEAPERVQVSADRLAAPQDPTSRPRAKGRTTARSLGGKHHQGDLELPSAGAVQDVRARWDAPDVTYTAPVNWTDTEMGRGVMLTGGLCLFFMVFGYLLFSITNKAAKTF